jgi:Icc-related predicted phosphoesterase
MKIHLLSDLHMEFAPHENANPGADILILSGDILVAERFTRGPESPYYDQAQYWKHWFDIQCRLYEHVIYVAGNHEHYFGRFYDTIGILRNNLGHLPNLHILDNDTWDYDGFRFVGTTLWTDFDHDNFKAMLVKDGLNDYKYTQGRNYRKLTTGETSFYHQKALNTIDKACVEHNKVIVVGHHAPSYQSVSEEYRTGRYSHLNPGYASHLDRFIDEHDNIVLWTHGHMHSSSDYMIGNTRIVANPRGYASITNPVPENESFDPNFILEI